MAQITAAPAATLVPRQDLDSLLSAGLSFLSSVVSPQTTDDSSFDTTTTSRTTVTRSTSTRIRSTTTAKVTRSTLSQTSSQATSYSTFTYPTATTSLSDLDAQSATSTPSASSAASSSKHSRPIVPIILGVVLGLLFLALIAVFVLCWRRRRRNGAPLFRRKRSESPLASDGDLESLDEPMTENTYVYPSVPPPYQLARQHPDSGSYDSLASPRSSKYGAAARDSPFEDNYRSGYDRRRSLRSLSLGPVPEQAERDRTGSLSSIRRKPVPTRERSFSAGGRPRSNGPWVPPRSTQRPFSQRVMSPFVPRKPVPGTEGGSAVGSGLGQQGSSRFGGARRHSSWEPTLPDAHHRF